MGKKITEPGRKGARAPAVVLDDTRPLVTRDSLVPGYGMSHAEKLRTSRAVDLRDNAVVQRLGGGYLRVLPRDPARRHG